MGLKLKPPLLYRVSASLRLCVIRRNPRLWRIRSESLSLTSSSPAAKQYVPTKKISANENKKNFIFGNFWMSTAIARYSEILLLLFVFLVAKVTVILNALYVTY